MDGVFPSARRPTARGRRGDGQFPLSRTGRFFSQHERAVGSVVNFEIEGGGEKVREAGEVIGAETAADAERCEGRIGEDDALAGTALEFEDELSERRAAEAQQWRLPGESAGNFVGGGGGDDDGGRERCG